METLGTKTTQTSVDGGREAFDSLPPQQSNSRKTFPYALYDILEEGANGLFEDIVSWTPCGTGFKVHNRDVFVSAVLPRYSKMSKYKSFGRQLQLWGFTCTKAASYRGACKCSLERT